jgi:hypothetical protein
MEDKKNVAVNIMKSYEEKYNIYYPLVERIINKKIVLKIYK